MATPSDEEVRLQIVKRLSQDQASSFTASALLVACHLTLPGVRLHVMPFKLWANAAAVKQYQVIVLCDTAVKTYKASKSCECFTVSIANKSRSIIVEPILIPNPSRAEARQSQNHSFCKSPENCQDFLPKSRPRPRFNMQDQSHKTTSEYQWAMSLSKTRPRVLLRLSSTLRARPCFRGLASYFTECGYVNQHWDRRRQPLILCLKKYVINITSVVRPNRAQSSTRRPR